MVELHDGLVGSPRAKKGDVILVRVCCGAPVNLFRRGERGDQSIRRTLRSVELIDRTKQRSRQVRAQKH